MATATDDWTKNDETIDVNSFVIPSFVAHKTADEVEAENGSEDIEPGTYELECLGLAGIKREVKDMYLNGQRLVMETYSARVRFCLPDDRGKQTSDFVMLPPADPDSYNAWANAATKKDEKSKGFWANKYIHLVERLFGVVIPKGSPIPAECCVPANWKGRKVIATVEPGNSYEKTVKDTDTGQDRIETKAGRNGIKLYSYKATDATKAGYKSPASQRAQQGSLPGVGGQQPNGRSNGGTTAAHPAQASPRPTTQAPPQLTPAQRLQQLQAAYQQAIASEDFDAAKNLKAQIAQLQGGAAAPANRGPVPRQEPAMAGAGAGRSSHNSSLDDI